MVDTLTTDFNDPQQKLKGKGIVRACGGKITANPEHHLLLNYPQKEDKIKTNRIYQSTEVMIHFSTHIP